MLTLDEFCKDLEIQKPENIKVTEFTGITTLDDAGEKDISFFTRSKFRKNAAASKSSMIIVPEKMKWDDPRAVKVPNIWTCILYLINKFNPPKPINKGIHSSAVIDKSAEIGDDVNIGPLVVIEAGVQIGNGTTIEAQCFIGKDTIIENDVYLHPRVTIYHESVIGNRVIVHSGAVIGADGFRYEPIDRVATKIPQVGNVVIADDVELGANATIDRASFTSTTIGARTKIDNLVHIAHNVVIGSDCIIVGQAGVAGSTELGRGVVLGGQVGIADNTKIGDGTNIGGQSGVKGNIAPGSMLLGSPATDVEKQMAIIRSLRRLPSLLEKIEPYLNAEGLDTE